MTFILDKSGSQVSEFQAQSDQELFQISNHKQNFDK